MSELDSVQFERKKIQRLGEIQGIALKIWGP